MDFETQLKSWIKNSVIQLFDLDNYHFERIVVSKKVVQEIIDFAIALHPKEFVAFFGGRIIKKTKTLYLHKLYYQEFVSSNNSATPIFHFADKSFYGSIHSHPGPRNTPSSADKYFFQKTGIVHAIIAEPYTLETIAFYNHHAEQIIVHIE